MNSIKTSPYQPTELQVQNVADNRVRINVFPFEQGYAITFAHPIKRLLLSCCAGYTTTAIKIEGVAHEFDSVRGIVEDVAPFIVNIKNLKFKIKGEQVDRIEVDYEFDGALTLVGKHLDNDLVEIINKDLHLATINKDTTFKFSLVIQKGIGYVPSENIRESTPSGFIPLDAFFTPVRLANYEIENVLVESDPNFERIVFDIETNGQISPVDAFKEAISTMHSQMKVFGADLSSEPVNNSAGIENSPELNVLMSPIEILNLEHRPSNCLQNKGIKYVGELVLMDEAELKSIKNLGKKSYDEIAQKLADIGFAVGTELPATLVNTLNKRLSKQK
ncbi:DNA-directed RNA polymerase subunit alpha [Helicobacter sp. 13S00401-1]|uniref:DNA-directed RNA polymerase subunit alpha n=1 Tax=Helicobacter sp. 13S00401-1 TaxID=1905758 RepID=UPI000BA5DA4E|nr:DNA-directed RNA polymerase subunit alpha [Helicobacter sp. 13S00401-1]PAF51193.1 DNA-directed RNA polymerase subunit alpha [Helicobacter sp. 13S00401-1]